MVRPPTRRALRDVRRRLLAWYRREHRDFPWRTTRDPYAVLVSEVMLQQTQAARIAERFPREAVEARNRLDALVYEVEKNVKEWGDKLGGDAKSRLESASERARKALKQDDLDEVRSATEELSQAYSAAGAEMYQAQQAAGAGAGPDAGFTGGATAGAGFEGDATAQAGGAGQQEEDVVEADYEIVEEEKK